MDKIETIWIVGDRRKGIMYYYLDRNTAIIETFRQLQSLPETNRTVNVMVDGIIEGIYTLTEEEETDIPVMLDILSVNGFDLTEVEQGIIG